jgi:hypothetical protein
MTPTKRQIEDLYNILFPRTPESEHATIRFMRDAALKAIEQEPFRPGEVVVSKISKLEIIVTQDAEIDEHGFPGTVIKGDNEHPVGCHHKHWNPGSFTRKNPQP